MLYEWYLVEEAILDVCDKKYNRWLDYMNGNPLTIATYIQDIIHDQVWYVQ